MLVLPTIRRSPRFRLHGCRRGRRRRESPARAREARTRDPLVVGTPAMSMRSLRPPQVRRAGGDRSKRVMKSRCVAIAAAWHSVDTSAARRRARRERSSETGRNVTVTESPGRRTSPDGKGPASHRRLRGLARRHILDLMATAGRRPGPVGVSGDYLLDRGRPEERPQTLVCSRVCNFYTSIGCINQQNQLERARVFSGRSIELTLENIKDKVT